MRLFFALAMLSASLAVAEEKPVEIPLKEVWAEAMPGTRNVRELQRVPETNSNEELYRRSLVEQFKRPLRKGLPPDRADKGFAVPGNGLEALKRATDVITQKSERPKSLSKDDFATVVFFSHSAGSYVRLDSVERSGPIITIKWHFLTHATLDMSAHFALIPLGKLSPGKYEVKIVELPLKTGDRVVGYQPFDPKLVQRIVCQPFSFTVK
jgi:hypothetical protein